ncbi:MAG: hypothetical protein WKF87_18615 [Chryseolinea sp.]
MKKIVSVLVVLVVISSVAFAGGIDKPDASSGVAIVKQGTTFRLYYKGFESNNVKVSILDSDKKVLFSETLFNVDGFVRPYNFTNLAEGHYTIEIADRHNRHSENIDVVRDKSENLAHILKVTGEDGKYLLTVSNKKSDDITVRIFDGKNQIIYDEVQTVSTDFARIYNLKKYTGKFTFEVTDGSGNTKSISY